MGKLFFGCELNYVMRDGMCMWERGWSRRARRKEFFRGMKERAVDWRF